MTIHPRIRQLSTTAAVLGVAAALLTGAAGSASALTQGTETAKSPAPTATVDRPLTAAFGHYGDTGGRWTGADSAYSVKLSGGRIAWLYSDTFLGTVNPDHSRPVESPFIHNSIVVQDHGKMTTYTGGTPDSPRSLAAVPGGDEQQDWYWFGDGTVEGSHLRVLLLEFKRTGDQPFDFAFERTAIASFSTSTMKLEGITQLPAGPIQWGSSIYEDGGYTYVYGVEDLQQTKYMHIARVRSGQLTTAGWEYFGDTGWSKDPAASKRIMDGVSNEFSVTKFKGAITLVTGDATEPLSSKIVMYQSRSVTGPFTDKTVLYQTPETGGNVFTYNAKAHPELGTGHNLVITYNVNSFDTNDVYRNVDNYRPRYIDVTVPPTR